MSSRFAFRMVSSLLLYLCLFMISTYLMIFIGVPEFRVWLTGEEVLVIVALFAIDLLWQIVSFRLFGLSVDARRTWLLANVLISLFLAPTVEEILTRFYLMKRWLIDTLGLSIIPAFIISNLVFVALHWLEIKGTVGLKGALRISSCLFVSGGLISVIYVFSGFNLFTAILLHSLINTTPVLLEYINLPKIFKKL